MIIPDRIHVSITKARMVREAKGRALNCKRSLTKAGGGTARSSSVTRLGNQPAAQRLIDNILGQNRTAAAAQLAENRAKQMLYTRMETVAGMLSRNAENLLKTGENSVFGQEDEAGKKKEAVAEVRNFVNNYNLLLGRLNSSGENTDTAYSKKLSAYVAGCAGALEKIGITAGSSGMLSLDENRLKEAESADIEAVFHEKDSFGEKAGKLAEDIREMAEEKMAALERSCCYGSAGYTRYGTAATGYDMGSYHSKA